MAIPLLLTLLLTVLLTVSPSAGQFMTTGTTYGSTMGTSVGAVSPISTPGMGMGMMGTTGFHRPGYQTGYGYGYSSTNLRSASDEASDSNLKAAMAPLNNVMASLPSVSNAPVIPASSPPAQGRDASGFQQYYIQPQYQSQYQPMTVMRADAGHDSKPVTTDSKTGSSATVDKAGQEQAGGRELPTTTSGLSSCCCPCNSAYSSWLYGSPYPLYDFNRLLYAGREGALGLQDYSYSYPYVYFNPAPAKTPVQTETASTSAQPAAGKSARTFSGWLPWLNSNNQGYQYQQQQQLGPYGYQSSVGGYRGGYYKRH